jgi:citrate lyase subunit beta / citryl-CoA lyase
MLFVPAHVDKFVHNAHTRGADAYILDLEDGVPVSLKEEARMKVASGAKLVSQSGAGVLVRINSEPELAYADIDAAVNPAISAIIIPKVELGETVRTVAAYIDAVERKRALPRQSIWLIAQIEDVRALPRLDEIATSSPRLLALSLGSEDFSASAGMDPIPEALLWPNQQVLFACARANIMAGGCGRVASVLVWCVFHTRDPSPAAFEFRYTGRISAHATPRPLADLIRSVLP